jgi:hypothetical protein
MTNERRKLNTMDLLQILSAYPIWTVIIIGVATLIGVYKFIVWCKATWSKREEFKQAAFQQGVEK